MRASPQAMGDLLFVDDDADLRTTLADLVQAVLGRQILGAADIGEVAALGPRAVACSLAIIDLYLGDGKPDGFDTLTWLKEHGFRGRAVFLTGHVRVVAGPEFAGVTLLAKPLGVDQLLSIIERTP